MSNTAPIQVPDIGDFDTVEVIEVLVKVGDVVKAEQSLITVESDKASMEIPSSHSGVVQSINVKVGDKVKQGSVVVHLELGAASAASAPAAATAVPASVPSVVATAAPQAPPHRLCRRQVQPPSAQPLLPASSKFPCPQEGCRTPHRRFVSLREN